MPKTYEECWDEQEKYEGKPHGWVQWKGTNACIDIHCECGVLGHIDGEFVYSVKCPNCGRLYFLNGHIQLIEFEEDPDENAKVFDAH